MDNQQGRLARYGWLGGIIDGEGTITLSVQHRKDRKTARPLVQMMNTNALLVEAFCRILTEAGVAWWRGIHRKQYGPQHKLMYVIRIEGHRRVTRFLEVFAPFIIAKQPVLQAVQRYMVLPNTGWSMEKDAALREIRELNQQGIYPQRLIRETGAIGS